MPTLVINGQRIKVDDSFDQLKPEQQNATVDEIAASIGSQPQADQSDRMITGNNGIEATKGARVSPGQKSAEQQQGNYLDAGVSWLEGAGDLPIIGPALTGASDYIGSNLYGLVTGQDPAQIRQEVQARRGTRAEQYPASRLSGQIAGNVVALGAVGSTAVGAEALGMTGAKLLPRMARSAGSNALISGADQAARGGNVSESLTSAGISGVIGGAVPLVGAGISRGIAAVGDRVSPLIRGALNPDDEAARRVGMALTRDMRANPSSVMNAGDEAAARGAGLPVANVDRGGETTRALARSVANQNPEARQVLGKMADDRFATQSQRATDFVRRITNGNVDDIGYQQAIRDTARLVNAPAYRRAFDQPQARALWTNELRQLMSAPAMQQAARTATTRGANRAAVSGFKPVANPFSFADDGTIGLRTNPNGTRAIPTLEFWDQVKRNLDGMIGKAQRAGDNTLVSDLQAIKGQLVKTLDDTVPQYRVARQGAASYFDADDALEAGKKFAVSPRSIPEASKAFAKFSGPEKAAFQTGYASELIDRIKASSDRTNVINSVFGSQAARESMELVFGRAKAREIEAYVRVEDIVDRLRGALGNSTTPRQLIEMGIGATGGYVYSGGDLSGAAMGALMAKGARFAGERVDAKVMQRVANLLVSENKANLQLAIKAAAANPGYMRALESLGNALAIPARSAGMMTAQ